MRVGHLMSSAWRASAPEPLDVLVRGFDGHRERFMITGICYGCAPIGAAWIVGVLLVGRGPVGLVEHRPRHPEAAHSLSLDRAAGITRPIESASTLMPPGNLRDS